MKGELRAVVKRGAESSAFLAFVFSAFASLGLSVIDDLSLSRYVSIVLKLAYFICSFYILMRNPWATNKLIGWYTQIKNHDFGRIA